MQKMIRYSYQQSASTKKTWDTTLAKLTMELSIDIKTRLLQVERQVHNTTLRHHRARLNKRTTWLKGKQRPQTQCLQESIPAESKVTDLTKTLNNAETELLSKGPQFVIQEKVNPDKTLHDIQKGTCRLAYQLRWRAHAALTTSSAPTDNGITEEALIPRHPSPNTLTTPPLIPDTETVLRRINAEIIAGSKHALKQHPNKSNLSNTDKSALASHKARADLVIAPSDKGGGGILRDYT